MGKVLHLDYLKKEKVGMIQDIFMNHLYLMVLPIHLMEIQLHQQVIIMFLYLIITNMIITPQD